MSKELPYFKFFPSEWITGDVTLCSMEAQGIFTNILGFYWNKNCSMSLVNAKQRFSKDIAGFNQLLEMGIIKTDKDENIIINFLDEQMNEFIDVSEKRSIAGKLGGLAKAKHLPKFAKAKPSNKEIDKEEEKEKSIYKTKPKDLQMVIDYMIEKKCMTAMEEGNKFYDHFNSNGWKVGGKAPMKDWRSAVNTWLNRIGIGTKQKGQSEITIV